MTQLTAAKIEIIREPRLALSALLELRRLTTTYLSSLTFTDSEESHDAAARDKTGEAIRGQQFRPRTAAPEGGRTASNLRTHAVDESAGEDHGRGSGQ
jgi:hypothetical protein